MSRFPGAEASLLGWTLLMACLTVSLCQRDCTGADCPQLHNCIQEVLESGACCASCLQKGCTCEGYQYYDCVSAGFKNGKVPEGESYFVDYGSTECSCPAGGGRISCHFISCPEIPPNCIKVLEPADGCMQCERVGCVHGGKKYEAGHSFHISPCRVCHCPNEGGQLMCYPVPDCDPEDAHQPRLAATADELAAGRREAQPHTLDEHSHRKHFTTTYHHAPNGDVPLFKPPPLDKEEQEDYDYGPIDFPESFPQPLPFPTLPSSSDQVVPLFRDRSERVSAFQSFDGGSKLELIERYGAHDHPADKEEVTETPQSTVRPDMQGDATTAGQHSQGLTSVPFGDQSPLTRLESPVHEHDVSNATFPSNHGVGGETRPRYPPVISESEMNPSVTVAHQHNASSSVTPKGSDRISGGAEGQTDEQRESHHPKEQRIVAPDSDEEADADDGEKQEEETFQKFPEPEGKDVSYNMKPAQQERGQDQSEGYEKTTPEPSTDPPRGPEQRTAPVPPFTTATTSQPPVKPNQTGPSRKPEQRLVGLHEKEREEAAEAERSNEPDEGPGVSADDVLLSCCMAGQSWAMENHHCSHMALLDSDNQSTCSVAQKQCCLSSVKESRCEAGVTSARRGGTCRVEETDPCTDDSHEVCCSCCALGLWAHREGRGCNAHQYLAYPCGHIFLTCCEEEEGPSQIPLKTKQKPRPTAMPRRVSDSRFPKEAFSIRGSDEAANAVEEQEDVDECQLYAGQLCQHTCVNVWGSYRCDCHRGYVLQPDSHSCAPVSPDEDNRVREHVPALVPTQASTTTSTSTTSPIHLDPCAENGPCSQQCAVLAGRARCSCFPGFSLMTDGHTCQDVDECAANAHSCRPSERCVNTVGSFVCEVQVTCPAGYQLRTGVCEDVDECALPAHDCGVGSACQNTPGSFLCKPKHKCVSGFAQDAHGNCVDINECNSLSGLCSSGFNCINTVGSYTCQKKVILCSHGYHASPDGAKCVDIDECQMGTHRCAVGQICHNLPGSYRCDCQTGYQYDALRKVCTDVNECWRFAGRLCSQTCENTPGSYRCSCTAGFSLAFDGKNCEDVNECDRNPCSQECANIYGSYQCYCRQGYHLKEDGHTCEDIDECSQSIGNLCSFQCVNVAGSYRCACPPHGYVMSASGHACRDIDECTTGSHNCSFGQTCYNLQGGFRCLSFDCPPNYKKVSDTRCERTSCPVNALDCQSSPVRITYYQLSFKTNIIIPAQIFRIGPSPAYSGDHIVIGITKGNDEGYFSTRKLNSFTGAVYLQRQVREPRDFLIDVEMKLLRQGSFTSFIARIYVFITSSAI